MQSETIPLKDPPMAALFAWLIPGLGHLYQGRVGKAILFAVCIWTTFLYGMYLGNGGIVFFRWDAGEQRWAYICQVGMGLPALPALLQSWRVSHNRNPILRGYEKPPDDNELNRLNELGRYFELGTVYTMIAGLLNVLVVFDAYNGPAYLEDEEDEEIETASKLERASVKT